MLRTILQIIYIVFAVIAFLGAITEKKDKGYIAVFAIITLAITIFSMF